MKKRFLGEFFISNNKQWEQFFESIKKYIYRIENKSKGYNIIYFKIGNKKMGYCFGIRDK